MGAAINKICLIYTSPNLGQQAIAASLVRAVNRKLPKAEVLFVGNRFSPEIYAGNRQVRVVIPDHLPPAGEAMSELEQQQLFSPGQLKDLSRADFDATLVLNLSEYFDILTYSQMEEAGLILGKQKIAFIDSFSRSFSVGVTDWLDSEVFYQRVPAGENYLAFGYLGMLRPLLTEKTPQVYRGKYWPGIYPGEFLDHLSPAEVVELSRPQVWPSPIDHRNWQAFCRRTGLGKPKTLIALAPGANSGQTLPAELLLEAIEACQARSKSRPKFLVATKTENDLLIAARLKELIEESGREVDWQMFHGRTIGELALMFSQAELVIAGDSGPAHVAAAVEARRVVLYKNDVRTDGFTSLWHYPFDPLDLARPVTSDDEMIKAAAEMTENNGD